MIFKGEQVKILRLLMLLITVFSLLAGLLAAGLDRRVYAAEENGEADAFTLNYKKLVLKPGKKERLKITELTGTEQVNIQWISRNTEIATVSKRGKVTAVSEGNTTIIAKITYIDLNDGGAEKKAKLKCRVKVEEEKTVRIAAVGDALIHENILNSGKTKKGNYNYDALFENMTEYLEDFDVKIINQETIFTEDEEKFAGYPSFGTPTALGDSMRKAGFNVITAATNHAYDRGKSGIEDTVAYWSQYEDEILLTGIYGSEEAYDTPAIREYNGIKIAFLNYTTLLNSGAKREPFNIRMYKEKQVLAEIKSARRAADLVVVLPHWGIEYEHEPSSEQERMAEKMAEAGADVIIGCHPHVVQPLKVIETDDGRRVPCYYSLGNYVSNMFWFKCQLEGLAELTVTKWNGKTTVKTAEFTPIVNHISSDDKDFTVYLLSDYQGDLWKEHYMNHRYWMGLVTPERLENLFKSIGNEKY